MDEEVTKYPPIKSGKYVFNYIDLYEIAEHELVMHSTAIYGDSGDGKSFITNTLLDAISPHINILHIFCPTAKIDKSFPMAKYTSPAFVHETLDLNCINNIIARSAKNCEMYNMIADTDYMNEVVKKFILKIYKTNNQDKLYEKTVRMHKRIHRIEDRFDYDNANINERNEHKEEIVRFYKLIMYTCKKYLRDNKISIPNEYKELALPVMFYDLKPCDVILTNDLGDVINGLNKKESQITTSLVMKERHFGITTIHLLQNVTYLKKCDRQQIKVNLFISPLAISSYISTLMIKGDLKNRLEAASECILAADKSASKRRYPVIVYLKIPNIIAYTYADSKLELDLKGNTRLYKKLEPLIADSTMDNPLMDIFTKK